MVKPLTGIGRRQAGIAAALIATVVAGCGVAYAITLEPAIAPIDRPMASTFSVDVIARGASLAAIGDCAVCHTSAQGATLAGSRPLETPFGTIYTTNITPDDGTGIGRWSGAAFRRAMHSGISRDGHHLYPALPYEHFTTTTDGDLDALYAYLMTRTAVASHAPDNEMIPPLGFRPLLFGWKLLFLHSKPNPIDVLDATQSAEWNRGAYLAGSMGHCGGCHTPRNALGGEETGRALQGGVAEGWNAPPLDRSNPTAANWSPDDLYQYLRTGMSAHHSAAAGPMAAVSHSLGKASEADVRAIALYVSTSMGIAAGTTGGAAKVAPIDHADAAAARSPLGAHLFAGACAGCHATGAPMLAEGRPPLWATTSVQSNDPRNLLQIVLQGLHSPTRERRPLMPPFADSLTDTQVAALASYLRARYSDRDAWPQLDKAAAQARGQGTSP